MSTEQIFNKALGAYLGFACGDALGATVEFMSPRQIQKCYGQHRDMIGGGWLGLAAGQVTDDTQMSLALGQAIIDRQGWCIKTIADNFVDWLASNPPDVGNTCRRGILRYRDTGELAGPPSQDEAGNGACMRNLPVVLATLHRPDLFEVWSLEQSHITHHHPLSDAATLVLGQMVKLLINGQGMLACQQLADGLIEQHGEFAYKPYPGKASGYIVDTVQTVLHHFFNTDNFEACLLSTVNQGGDADTTGALVGMLAGARFGVAHIPTRWLECLDTEVVARIREQVNGLVRLADAGKTGS
jgi:ADP-ribosyl-[dinitrogen reductase] hydrolase